MTFVLEPSHIREKTLQFAYADGNGFDAESSS
jgi:hypothetical protein